MKKYDLFLMYNYITQKWSNHHLKVVQTISKLKLKATPNWNKLNTNLTYYSASLETDTAKSELKRLLAITVT